MVATLIGLIFGFTTGAIVAGLTLMEDPRRWGGLHSIAGGASSSAQRRSDGSYVQPQSGNAQSLASELRQ